MSSQPYKAPELLLKYKYYAFPLDMWGVGLHLAALVFQKKQVFGYDESHSGMLKRIANVLGSDGLEATIKKYDMRKPVPPVLPSPKLAWKAAFRKMNPRLDSLEALDLIDKLLRWDPEERLTASEALQHPFLSNVEG